MRRGAFVLLAAMTVAVAGAPRVADAQPGRTKAGAKHVDEDAKLKPGLALFESREHAKAATEFERVYTTTKDTRALYWLGRACQDGGQLARALRAYKLYLKEGGAAVAQARSVEVLGYIQTLTMQVAVVTVTAPDGATIAVDDVDVGTAPLAEPLPVDPGKHTIRATRDGAAQSKAVDVAEESRTNVDLTPTEPREANKPPVVVAAPPPPATRPPESPAASSSGGSALTVGGLAVATLLAAGSVYFGIRAVGTAHDFDVKKREVDVSRSDLDGLQSDTRLQAGLSLGLGLTALGVAGVTLFVLKRPSAEKTASSKVVVTGNGVAVGGSF